MQALLRWRPSLVFTPQRARHVLLGLFALMGGLYIGQAKQLMKSASAGDQKIATITEAMQSRFNGMSLALMSFLQTHDSLSLERIKSDGVQASLLLQEFKTEALKEGIGVAYAQVEKEIGRAHV